jgi:hypothetical protein
MITQGRLIELLRYSPVVGVFEWRKSRPRVRAGFLAGAVNPRNGYVNIFVDGRSYRAHRLAWLYMTGAWPENDLDHIDGDKSNNAFSNLRQATQSQNMMNSPKKATNTSGVKGVSFNKARGRWEASVRYDGKKKHLGMFEDLSQAESAVVAARNRLHGEFVNHGMHRYQAEEMLDG